MRIDKINKHPAPSQIIFIALIFKYPNTSKRIQTSKRLLNCHFLPQNCLLSYFSQLLVIRKNFI